MSNYGYSYGSSSSRRPTSGSYSSYSTTSPSSSTTTYGTSYRLRNSGVSTDVSKYTSSLSDRAKTSSDYSINSINSGLNSINSSLNRLNLDRYNSSSERTSDRYSSTSSILGSSSSSLTGRTVDRLTGSTHRRLPPLESSSNALGSSIIYPSSGSELRSSRSVRSSISSRNTYDKYSSNYENNEQSGSSLKKQGGLQNIGNSCYLNSVIQCLLHCDPIRDYFVKGRFKSEINSRSKTKGKCADATSSLFEDLLSGRTSSPSSVKSAVNRFSGLFRGTSQEDAQEFLRWYLEALHEDVQKVTSKPRITKEAESAREAWSQYTSRENSQIVDLCVGQLKSSLTCSHCGYVSNVRAEFVARKILGTIIFMRIFQVWDPFWDLSVPLPSGARNVEDCLEEFRKEEVEIHV